MFQDYAKYYDLLYEDKDYIAESNYIDSLIKKHYPNATSILELGCGTGKHAVILTEYGYSIHCVDRSKKMIQEATQRIQSEYPNIANKLKFSHGDVRNYQYYKSFDVVISLFHVMSYQTTNSDLKDVFTSARKHLKPGGIFIFDCWYGPAVLTLKPEIRVKRVRKKDVTITRIAEPITNPNNNIVEVNYDLFINNVSTGTITETQETHNLRYLFKPEIELLVEETGLELVDFGEWMTGNSIGCNTWSVYFIAKL